jgi:hypothetical protein
MLETAIIHGLFTDATRHDISAWDDWYQRLQISRCDSSSRQHCCDILMTLALANVAKPA